MSHCNELPFISSLPKLKAITLMTTDDKKCFKSDKSEIKLTPPSAKMMMLMMGSFNERTNAGELDPTWKGNRDFE